MDDTAEQIITKNPNLKAAAEGKGPMSQSRGAYTEVAGSAIPGNPNTDPAVAAKVKRNVEVAEEMQTR